MSLFGLLIAWYGDNKARRQSEVRGSSGSEPADPLANVIDENRSLRYVQFHLLKLTVKC